MSPFCSKCGNEINENATFCSKCGAQASTVKNESSNQSNIDFMKMSVIILIILDIITLGFYSFYWIKRQERGYKKVNAEYRLNGMIYVLYIITQIIVTIASIATSGVGFAVSMIPYIIFLILSYDIANKMNAKQSSKYSQIAIFFFNIWYLQYRINKDYK